MTKEQRMEKYIRDWENKKADEFQKRWDELAAEDGEFEKRQRQAVETLMRSMTNEIPQSGGGNGV